MPKLGCLCGQPVDLVKTPNRNTFLILNEALAEDIAEKMIEAHKSAASVSEFSKMAFTAFTFKSTGFIQGIECQNCGRVAVFSQPKETPDFWLKREIEGTLQGQSMRSLYESARNPADEKN